MKTDWSQDFLNELALAFGFLEPYGFTLKAETIKETPTYVSAAYVGKSVAIELNFDYIGKYVSCRIFRVLDGRLNSSPAAGGFREDLFCFLMDEHGFRGRVPRPDPETNSLSSLMRSDLLGYAELIKREGSFLLKDDWSLMFPGGRSQRQARLDNEAVARARSEAEAAFKARDYGAVARLYESIQDGLTPAELKKFQYAKNHLESERERRK